jgi:hypothetical protein
MAPLRSPLVVVSGLTAVSAPSGPLQAASNNRHGASNHHRFNIMRRNFQQDRQAVPRGRGTVQLV